MKQTFIKGVALCLLTLFFACKTPQSQLSSSFQSHIPTQQVVNDETLLFSQAVVHPSGHYILMAGKDIETQKFIIKVWDTRWPPPQYKSLIHAYGLDAQSFLQGPGGHAKNSQAYMRFSPDGTILAVADATGLYATTFDPKKFKPLQRIFSGASSLISFSPGGSFFARVFTDQGSQRKTLEYGYVRELRQALASQNSSGLKMKSLYTTEVAPADINTITWHTQNRTTRSARKTNTTKVTSLVFADTHQGLVGVEFYPWLRQKVSFSSQHDYRNGDYNVTHHELDDVLVLRTPDVEFAEVTKYLFKFDKSQLASLDIRSDFDRFSQTPPPNPRRLFNSHKRLQTLYAPVANGIIFLFSLKKEKDPEDKTKTKYSLAKLPYLLCIPTSGDAYYTEPGLDFGSSITACNGRKNIEVYWMGSSTKNADYLYVVTQAGRAYQLNLAKRR